MGVYEYPTTQNVGGFAPGSPADLLARNDMFPAADQAARLALSPIELGDFCLQGDTGDIWHFSGTDPTNPAHWTLVYEATIDPLPTARFVDISAAAGGNGSVEHPFQDPQDAIDDLATAGGLIVISGPGNYLGSDLVLPAKGVQLVFLSLVPWRLGDFGSPRGLTRSVDPAQAVPGQNPGTVFQGHAALLITGNVVLSDVGAGQVQDFVLDNVAILGTVTGTGSTATIFGQFTGCSAFAAWNAPTLRFESRIRGSFGVAVTVYSVHFAENTVFGAVTVSAVSASSRPGMRNCKLTSWTGPASSYIVDHETLKNTTTPPASIVMLDDHAPQHEGGGTDVLDPTGLDSTGQALGNFLEADGAGAMQWASGVASHASQHENGGADEISVAGLSGTLADPQTPASHASSHQNGGADEVATATRAANAIPKGDATAGYLDTWIKGVSTPAISPAALTGDVNDYSPTGLSTARVVRIDPGAADRVITGLTAQEAGRLLLLVNISTSKRFTLSYENTSSVAANRFLGPGGADVNVIKEGAVMVYYDGTSARWRTVLPE